MKIKKPSGCYFFNNFQPDWFGDIVVNSGFKAFLIIPFHSIGVMAITGTCCGCMEAWVDFSLIRIRRGVWVKKK